VVGERSVRLRHQVERRRPPAVSTRTSVAGDGHVTLETSTSRCCVELTRQLGRNSRASASGAHREGR
jgi:hypothetical protein